MEFTNVANSSHHTGSLSTNHTPMECHTEHGSIHYSARDSTHYCRLPRDSAHYPQISRENEKRQNWNAVLKDARNLDGYRKIHADRIKRKEVEV